MEVVWSETMLGGWFAEIELAGRTSIRKKILFRSHYMVEDSLRMRMNFSFYIDVDHSAPSHPISEEAWKMLRNVGLACTTIAALLVVIQA